MEGDPVRRGDWGGSIEGSSFYLPLLFLFHSLYLTPRCLPAPLRIFLSSSLSPPLVLASLALPSACMRLLAPAASSVSLVPPPPLPPSSTTRSLFRYCVAYTSGALFSPLLAKLLQPGCASMRCDASRSVLPACPNPAPLQLPPICSPCSPAALAALPIPRAEQ